MTCITKHRTGGEADFDNKTMEYGRAIAKALSDLAPQFGAPAVEQPGGDNIALSVDAVPAVRALVSMAGIIASSIDDRAHMISTIETALACLAYHGGPAFEAHIKASVMARQIEHGDAMDARANVAGFTRPLRREDYN